MNTVDAAKSNPEAYKSFYNDVCAERRRAGNARSRARKADLGAVVALCEVWILWTGELYEMADAATYQFGPPGKW